MPVPDPIWDLSVLTGPDRYIVLTKDPFTTRLFNGFDQAFPSDDPLDDPDFDPVDYINSLFPNEQALVKLDDFVRACVGVWACVCS